VLWLSRPRTIALICSRVLPGGVHHFSDALAFFATQIEAGEAEMEHRGVGHGAF
jgi:hypothetical protein